MRKIRIINGKGDWEATPPTGASDADFYHIINDIVDTGGVVAKADGDSLVAELDTPGLGVQIAPGTIYVPNSSWTPNSFEPKFYTVVAPDIEILAISSNPSGSTRIDLIAQKVDKITTPNDDASNVCPAVVVEGVPGDPAPALPADHVWLAEVEVLDGASSITDAHITDKREQITFNDTILPAEIVTEDAVQTLTNKRVKDRVQTVTSDPTITMDIDNYDCLKVTALAEDAQFQVPAGTPTDRQKFLISIKDDGIAHLLTYNAIWRAIGITLPTTTVPNKIIYLVGRYNTEAVKYDVLGFQQEI